jgi:hypothetical protein
MATWDYIASAKFLLPIFYSLRETFDYSSKLITLPVNQFPNTIVEAKAPRTIKAMDISFIPLLVSSAIH